MGNCYRVVFESYDEKAPKKTLKREVLLEETIEKEISILDFSMNHAKQIDLLKKVGDSYLTLKVELNSDRDCCATCQGKLMKVGKHESTFHDVFTDHKVTMQRFKCTSCGWEKPSTVRTLLNGVQSAELIKIQSELGAKHTFRECEDILRIISSNRRQINNHDRVKQVCEDVGESFDQLNEEEVETISQEPALELIINVDGGHVKTTEDQRSIEAMTSVVYRPESLKSNESDTRNYITSKNCAASAKDDGGSQLIRNTIVAALKQGLTDKTHITALCDGAENCWKIVEGLRPLSNSITCILDWFHISMKIQTISFSKDKKEELMSVKWHLWRGNIDNAQEKLDKIIMSVDDKYKDKLIKFKNYIHNNKDKIVDYNERKEKGLVFTSNLAESTVESLINQRCKGHQHMRWSREGLNQILQLRAAISSNDWNNRWQTAVLTAIQKS